MNETACLRIFGARLREARQREGYSQRTLAELIGATSPWISDLERGEQKGLAAFSVYRLAIALNVSADYLLGLKDDLEEPPRLPAPARRARRREVSHDYA